MPDHHVQRCRGHTPDRGDLQRQHHLGHVRAGRLVSDRGVVFGIKAVAGTMKPWTERKQIVSALKNEHVRIGERTLPNGTRLRGLYALADFTPDDYVTSFHGRIISREQLVVLHKTNRALFDNITEYAVWSDSGRGHLYPEDIGAPGAHLINHSCAPNTEWAQHERGAMLI